MPRKADEVEQLVLAARAEHRDGQDVLGPQVGVPPRTVGRILLRHGVSYLRECDPKVEVGYDYVHSLVHYHSRLAYSEILPDEKGTTCAAFRRRAAAYFADKGISRIERVMTDNAFASRPNFTGNADRAAALASWVEHDNTARRHSSLRGRAPVSRLRPT
jgi:hypothetical protein